MENYSKKYKEVLEKLQECLRETDCVSEIKVNPQDALLYGKLTFERGRQTITIHIKHEDYNPKKYASSAVEIKTKNIESHYMPSLSNQMQTSQGIQKSIEEQLEMRNKFISETEDLIKRKYGKK